LQLIYVSDTSYYPRMDSYERCVYSDSEAEEECFDLYKDDPSFSTKEELEEFMQSCDLTKHHDSEEEDIDFESFSSIKKEMFMWGMQRHLVR